MDTTYQELEALALDLKAAAQEATDLSAYYGSLAYQATFEGGSTQHWNALADLQAGILTGLGHATTLLQRHFQYYITLTDITQGSVERGRELHELRNIQQKAARHHNRTRKD